MIERASAVHAKDNEMAKRHAKHVTKLSLSCASEKENVKELKKQLARAQVKKKQTVNKAQLVLRESLHLPKRKRTRPSSKRRWPP